VLVTAVLFAQPELVLVPMHAPPADVLLVAVVDESSDVPTFANVLLLFVLHHKVIEVQDAFGAPSPDDVFPVVVLHVLFDAPSPNNVFPATVLHVLFDILPHATVFDYYSSHAQSQ